MRRALMTIVIALAANLALAAPGAPKGHLVLIGGGEHESPAALHKFVELAGGPDAPIIVIPTASEEPDAAQYYTKIFTDGEHCTHVVALDIKTRADAARPDFVEFVDKARGIFFGGGDQVRITSAILGTPVGDAITRRFAEGAVVGGTSAGTACQSALMITGEGDFKVIRSEAVEMKQGFGFFRGVIVDQHFIARQRQNRLFTVIFEHPELVGVGVDEDTAVWVRPDNTLQVLGVGSVIVFDPKGAAVTRGAGPGGKDLLGVRDLKVHVLLPGDGYDLNHRTVQPAVTQRTNR